MLTLVFAMSLVDYSAFGAYMLVATPRPLAPGSRSVVDVLEAMVGVWEWALLASVALQTALCASSWRVYRALRMAGLYAPEKPSDVARDRQKDISVLEIICEAEDIDSLEQMEFNCCVKGEDGEAETEAFMSRPMPTAAELSAKAAMTGDSEKGPCTDLALLQAIGHLCLHLNCDVERVSEALGLSVLRLRTSPPRDLEDFARKVLAGLYSLD
eukprot:g11792.t1